MASQRLPYFCTEPGPHLNKNGNSNRANRATMLCPYHRAKASEALKAKRDERRSRAS